MQLNIHVLNSCIIYCEPVKSKQYMMRCLNLINWAPTSAILVVLSGKELMLLINCHARNGNDISNSRYHFKKHVPHFVFRPGVTV